MVANPDDERYKPLFGPPVPHADVRRRGAGPRPPSRRSREGYGHRDDLHLRRRHRRHLVARAEPAGRARSSDIDGRITTEPPEGIADRPRKRGLHEDGGQDAEAAHKSAVVELLRRNGRADRRGPRRSLMRSSSTSAATSPLEIVTTRQWYIRNGGRDEELRERVAHPRATSSTGTRRTCGTATTTGSTA